MPTSPAEQQCNTEHAPAPARTRGTEASTPRDDSGVVDMDTTGGANSSAQYANLGARANGARRLDAHLVFTLGTGAV